MKKERMWKRKVSGKKVTELEFDRGKEFKCSKEIGNGECKGEKRKGE